MRRAVLQLSLFGSSFTLDVRSTYLSMNNSHSHPPPAHPVERHILIVDDSPTQLHMLRRLLSGQGYDVVAACDGHEGLQSAHERVPDVIISDIEMPRMNGYELCRAVKDDERLRAVPVVLLTRFSTSEDVLLGLKAKADFYLIKPYNAEHLLARVKALFDCPPELRTDFQISEDTIEIVFGGQKHVVPADRRQMLDLLFSTYESAVWQNQELLHSNSELLLTQRQLKALNAQLQEQKAHIAQQEAMLREANARLTELATLDSLTGLRNHRAFNEYLTNEFARGARESLPLSLLMVDVDEFKSYNDNFGHPAGDEVLRGVARVLGERGRTSDVVARYGGEEFVAVLPNTDVEGALIMAERMRAAIESTMFANRRITVSCGAATVLPSRHDGDAAAGGDALIAAADRALYQSKAGGRNRTTHARDLPPIH